MVNLTAIPKQNMPATAIIFLQLPLSLYRNQLRVELINNYKNDWQITKIIESQNFYDNKLITECITELQISKDFLVNILIDEELLNNPYYSFAWSVLGVLSIPRLITVTSYKHYYNEILFTNINALQDRFLSEAAYYLEHHNISHYRPKIKIVGESERESDLDINLVLECRTVY